MCHSLVHALHVLHAAEVTARPVKARRAPLLPSNATANATATVKASHAAAAAAAAYRHTRPVRSVIAVLTCARRRAFHTCLKTLAVLLEAHALAASASSFVYDAVVAQEMLSATAACTALELAVEGRGVAVENFDQGLLDARSVVGRIGTRQALAAGRADDFGSEALAVQFQTLALPTVADDSGGARNGGRVNALGKRIGYALGSITDQSTAVNVAVTAAAAATTTTAAAAAAAATTAAAAAFLVPACASTFTGCTAAGCNGAGGGVGGEYTFLADTNQISIYRLHRLASRKK
jgi:chromodomain-helicase-DNA-binding protein 7